MSETACRGIVAERSGGMCETAIPGVCLGRATNMHHRRKEGRVWTPSNVLHLCGSGTTGCHGYIEANPAWANAEGLWLFAGDPSPELVSARVRWVNQRSWWILDDEGIFHWDGGEFEPLPLRSVT